MTRFRESVAQIYFEDARGSARVEENNAKRGAGREEEVFNRHLMKHLGGFYREY